MTRPCLLVPLALLVGPFPLERAASAADDDRPNVLLLLVDDLGPVLGCYGDLVAKTPHIDALAARGMRFDRAYCNQAVCAPSRFALMLGAHSTSTGLYGLGSELREIAPEAVSLPQHFAEHGGYRTESLGKVYHIGHGNHGDPQSFSVPHFQEKVIEYVDPASTPGDGLTREEAMFRNVPAPPGGMNELPRGAAFESPEVPDDAYADGRVAAETIERLRAGKERREEDGTPFFIATGFARPHLPFSAPQRYWDRYDPDTLPMPEFEELPEGSPKVAHKHGGEIRNYFPVPDKGSPEEISDDLARELIRGYYASTSYVDAQVGKVTDALGELGLAENTIVVLWGDHGFHLGDHDIWTKHTNYEQANHIPLLVAAPGVTELGSATDQLAESVDLFPTLAELAGLPAPNGPQAVDGLSLVPVLEDPAARVRDHAYHTYPKRKLGRAIRTERYRMVKWKRPGAPEGTADYELYDYETDPLETRNIAAESPEVLARLKKILAAHPEPVAGRRYGGNGGNGAPAADRDGPSIVDRPVVVHAEIKSRDPRGVVLAQGGRQRGYALHFVDGRPVFDVRVNGAVTRAIAPDSVRGVVRLEARLTAEAVTPSVDGEEVASAASPGFLAKQPKDGLSVGRDTKSAAGDYDPPHPFDGIIRGTRVEAGGEPPEVAEPLSPEEVRAGLEAHDRALFVHDAWIRDPYAVPGLDEAQDFGLRVAGGGRAASAPSSSP